MTQKIFDVENAEDMDWLWSILPDNVDKLTPKGTFCITYDFGLYISEIIKIDWHDKTEITRPIQEATEADIGKLCKFLDKEEQNNYGVLEEMTKLNDELIFWKNNTGYKHCRRLTKQEIEELC